MRQLRKRTALKTSNSPKSVNVTRQEKRRDKTKNMSDSPSKSTVMTCPTESRSTENKNIADSAKKLQYDKYGNMIKMEKPDTKYKANERAKLKSLRIVPEGDVDIELYGTELIFKGFIEPEPDEETENSNRIKQAIAGLESAQKLIGDADDSNSSIPQPTPLNNGLENKEIEFPRDILYEIPDSLFENSKIKYDKNAKIKKYTLSNRIVTSKDAENEDHVRLVYTVTTSTLQNMLKNGLTWSEMEILPW